MRVDPQWMDGWLAFQTRGERRRLAPYPELWAHLDDAHLEELCNDAQLVGGSRRLIE